jgi:hypothetical protein
MSDSRWMAPEQVVELLPLDEQVAYWKAEWAAVDADYGRLEVQRDALLEACRAATLLLQGFRDYESLSPAGDALAGDRVKQCREAIEKATGAPE